MLNYFLKRNIPRIIFNEHLYTIIKQKFDGEYDKIIFN